MSRHLRLRFAVLTAVAAGAMLLPASAAVASGKATPNAKASAAAEKKAEDAKAASSKTLSPEELKKMEALKQRAAGKTPRGGVAAGEAPVANLGDSTGSGTSGIAALTGSATGALLLAGAGALVIRRRRSAEQPTG